MAKEMIQRPALNQDRPHELGVILGAGDERLRHIDIGGEAFRIFSSSIGDCDMSLETGLVDKTRIFHAEAIKNDRFRQVVEAPLKPLLQDELKKSIAFFRISEAFSWGCLKRQSMLRVRQTRVC